jgi:integrase
MSIPRRKLFTDKWLQSLQRKPLRPDDPGYRKPWWDTRAPGLCIRQGADVAFYTGKRPPNSSKFTWVKLGDYPALPLADARSRNNEIVGAIVDGRPPPPPAKDVVTFADVAEEFIETVLPLTRKGQKKRTAKAEERAFRQEVLPVLGAKPIIRITHRDIVDCLEGLAGRTAQRGARLETGGPHAARKVLPTLNRLFEWAAYRGKGGLQSNPMTAVVAAELLSGKSFNTVRDHVPNDVDLRIIWQAAEATPYPFGPLIKALLLTGQRLSEIAEACWSELDEAHTTLEIPPERMKNRQAHAVPLTEWMRALLDELPHFKDGDFLFSTAAGKRPISGFSKMKARFDRTVATIGDVQPWRLHDLRRAVRTGLSRAGVLPFHAELVIAHQQMGVHAVYDLFRYHTEKLDALAGWEALLVKNGITDPPPANVVSLRDAAA